MIIKYFLTEKFPSFDDQTENKEIETEYPFIYKYLYKKCINVKNENTKISDLINILKNISCQEKDYEFSKVNIQNINEMITQYESIDQEIQNIPKLQYMIGLIWYEGKTVPQNINRANHYFKISAKNHFPDALYILGLLYLKGEYVQQNINKAIEYLTQASDLNHCLSQEVLGVNYILGNFFQKDINKGIKYLELSSKDSPLSQHHLGTIYLSKEYNNYNIDKTIYYFTKAANNNFCEAQNALGITYSYGIHCKRDMQKAIYYFSLGVEGNSVESEYNLGLIYLEGR